MKNLTTKLLAMAAITAGVTFSANAAVTLYQTDFSTDTTTDTSRILLANQAPVWGKNVSSAWSVSGGTLNNTATGNGSIASEGAVGTVYSVGSASVLLNQVTVSFDYNVGLDSTLYFNLIGLFENDGGVTSTQLHNTGTTNGAIQFQHEARFADVNMNNGLDASGSTGAAAASFAPGTSGSYKRTFNLYDYLQEGHSFVSLADYDYFTIVFSRNDSGAAGTGVSIDNFLFTASSAPEPSSLALIVMGGLMLLGRKKKLSNSSL